MRYQNLKAEMSREGITNAQIAEVLGMSSNNFNLKVNGRVPMTVEEVKKARDTFFPNASLDYLCDTDESQGNSAKTRERAVPAAR